MENEATKKQRRFLVEWSILNLFGWLIGFVLVFIMATNLETIKHFAWVHGWVTPFQKGLTGEAALVWFPLGLSVSILQWVKLRQLGINPFIWTLLTAIGCAIFATLYAWVLNFGSFEYRMKYDIPSWMINTGLVVLLPIGGAIIGGLQSAVVRKHISTPVLWIRAYTIALVLPAVLAPLAFLFKSFLLNLFYSFEFLWFLVGLRWFLLLGFLFIITALYISLSTGKILLKESNIDSATTKAG